MTPSHSMASLSLYIFTFNCALTPININTLSDQLFNGLSTRNPSPSSSSTAQLPDLLVLSLQELAPLPKSLIGGSFLVPYFARFHNAVEEAARKFTDGGVSEEIYTAVAAENLGMTGLMIFARDPNAIRDIETAGLGVGVWSTGNKGAVGIRLRYEDTEDDSGSSSTELTFVAAHLAAMEWEVERRNEDWKNIVRGLVFSSTAKSVRATSLSGGAGARSSSGGGVEERPLLSISPRDASIYKPTSHLFVAGDLNYRTSSIKPGPSDHKTTFPQPQDSENHENHWTKLLENDQLNHERRAGRTMHGLVEAPVTFPPTYKYSSKRKSKSKEQSAKSDDDEDEDDEPRWDWASHRWPSWCDRILYLPLPTWLTNDHPSAKIQVRNYSALPLMNTSDHRAVALDIVVPLIPIPNPPETENDDEETNGEEGIDPRIRPPFEIDPDWKIKRDKARMLELVMGFTFYLTATWEGVAVLAASVAGVVGGVYVLKAMLDF